MRSLAPTLSFLRAAALVGLVVVLAACSRNPSTGVGNLGPNGGPPGSQQEFLVTVGDRVFFDTDQSTLSPTAIATLDKQAAWLNRYTQYQHILIEGHADERGTREYNIALGARRANTVMNYLISKGVAASRLTMKSFGKERPVAICDNISCWSQNRRAVTVVQ
ncbi:MAG: peptidoglycan-associated lipoprotein Pal [Devosia sp.]|jgi:peptidoglycan-associated lipoprotein|nr:peptidoglycan-associated lipoprotein Pal [Devosiaceae bacterium]